MQATKRGQTMGVEAIKKTLRCSIRTSWRCVSEHRALFSVALLLYLLYKSAPRFCAFLLSCSPVIICTTLLLGVLLRYGSSHLDEDRKVPADISAPKFGTSPRNVQIKTYQRLSAPAVKENIITEASFGRGDTDKCIGLDESVPLLNGGYDGDERVDVCGKLEKMLTSIPSMVTLQKEVGMEEYMNACAEKESKDAFLSKDKGDEYTNLLEDVHQSRVDGKETAFGLYSSNDNVMEDVKMVAKPNHQGGVSTDSQSDEIADVPEHKAVDGAAGKCRWGRAFSVRQRKKLADIKIEASNSALHDHSEYSLCSPYDRIGRHDCPSGFDPDNADRYSPAVSLTDAAPVIDETNVLLGADFSGPHPINNNDYSDNHPNISSQNSQADSDSNDVTDNSKAKDDGEEKKDAGNEPAFLWTADDEKNAMDLGYSEMERNRRLEMLMTKRKSMKHIRFEIDGSNIGGIADNGSSPRPRVQPISAPRRNPFADEADMPGSAPSILHPWKSPFDFLTEQSNGSGIPARHNLDPQDQGMVFRRHESFNHGRPQRHVPRFKPCFVLEEFNSEEPSTGNFQRQFSDRSVSKLSVVSECDTVSSVGDPEHNELIRNYIRGMRESPSLLRQDCDPVYIDDECSDGIGSFVDNETSNAIIC